MIARIAGTVIDLDRVEIRRDGQLVAVRPRVFTVIEYLLAHRDRVVSKEELLDNIWGDRFVAESALTSSIKLARRVLGDDGQRQAVIKTIHGRGYRLVAIVHESDGSAPDLSQVGAAGDPPPPWLATGATSQEPGGRRSPHEVAPDAATHHEWPLVGRHELVDRITASIRRRRAVVVVEGQRGMGKSRVLGEAAQALVDAELSVVWLRGLAATRDVPLAALTHLVDSSALATDHSVDELARGDLFRRAVDALGAVLRHDVGLIIDDAEHLDSLTLAVVATLINNAETPALVALTPPGEESTELAALTRSAGSERFTLQPLIETDLDALLYRALAGPIDDVSARRLAAASRGRPGDLLDIIDASRRTGALERRDGSWQLVRAPSSSRSSRWPPPDLDRRALAAAERLSILPPIPISLAEELLDAESLDALDRLHLIGLDSSGQLLTIDDPILAASVGASIAPLRLASIKRELIDAFERIPDDPALAARLVKWSRELDRPVDVEAALRLAWSALLAGDPTATESLISDVDGAEFPIARLLAAELAFGRSQWRRAAGLFDAVPTDQLDDMALALVLRRRATLAVEHFGDREQPEKLDLLARDATPFVAGALRSRRLGMLAMLGRFGDVEADAPSVEPPSGVARIEWLVSVATAALGRGDLDATTEPLNEALALLPSVPPVWRHTSRDGILTLKCTALYQRGDLHAAARITRAELPIGRRTTLGFLPAIAAEIELEAGRPRAAREFVRASVSTSRRTDFPQYVGLCETINARAGDRLGIVGSRDVGLETAAASLARGTGVLRWRIAVAWGDLMASDGRGLESIPTLLELGQEASAAGALLAECDLLTRAASNDSTPDTARSVLPRLRSVADRFDGDLWPIRLAEAEARGANVSLDDVADRYETLGFALRAHACRAERSGRSPTL